MSRYVETIEDRERIARQWRAAERQRLGIKPDFWEDEDLIFERRAAALALEDDIGRGYRRRTKDNIRPLSWPIPEAEQRAL